MRGQESMARRREAKFAKYGIKIEPDGKGFAVSAPGVVRAQCDTPRAALKRAHQMARNLSRKSEAQRGDQG